MRLWFGIGKVEMEKKRTTPKICQCFYGHTLFHHFGQIMVESESDLAAGSIYSEHRGMLLNVHMLW